MELVLAAISSGGLIGVADQYLCLLIVGGGSRLGWFDLPPAMAFLGSWWFMGIIVVFWILTVAPAYATLLAPGVANSINT
ncbi:MAG: DUF4126 domain-containing protein, partial [Chloroflexi bacterium]|nr:DUF4126 domain-containing protein [Chloroflexota bacterium]